MLSQELHIVDGSTNIKECEYNHPRSLHYFARLSAMSAMSAPAHTMTAAHSSLCFLPRSVVCGHDTESTKYGVKTEIDDASWIRAKIH